jgi:large subunit ribosomal protein L15
VGDLERFDAESRVDPAAMREAGLVPDVSRPVKVLGQGDLTKKLTVAAAKFSASAAEKIAKAGGSTEKV